MHYQRLTRTGSLEQPIATARDEDRYRAKVDATGGPEACWLWTAKVEATGYGRIWWNGREESAHRIAYVLANGQIPESLTIDHRCNTRACV